MSILFDRDVKTIGKHINNIFNEGELDRDSTVANFATAQIEGNREVKREIEYYNMDVIISVGYRVKSQNGTRFRIWATNVLKDYIVKGYAINQKRLEEKQQEVKLLKDGIRIISRAISFENQYSSNKMLDLFANGLDLLDDYDHETLDDKGSLTSNFIYPSIDEKAANLLYFATKNHFL